MISFNSFIKPYIKGLSISEVLAFKESKKYWELRFKFDPWPMHEPIKRLVEFSKQEAMEVWNSGKNSGEDEWFIELVMVDQGLIPPTFTQVVDCSNCGNVMSKPTVFKSVANCAWCHTGFFNLED